MHCYCTMKGHFMNDCLKRKNQLEKDGKISNLSLAICETNLNNVPFNTC